MYKILITISLLIFSINIKASKSDILCHGIRTEIFSNQNSVLYLCSEARKQNKIILNEWQNCSDAKFYSKEKQDDAQTIIANCRPTAMQKYKVTNNNLLIKYYFDNQLTGSVEPLVLTTFSKDFTVNYKLLANFKNYTKEEIDHVILEIRQFNKNKDPRKIYSDLYILLAYAEIDPEFTLNTLLSLRTLPGVDGDIAQFLTEITNYAKLIKLVFDSNKIPKLSK